MIDIARPKLFVQPYMILGASCRTYCAERMKRELFYAGYPNYFVIKNIKPIEFKILCNRIFTPVFPENNWTAHPINNYQDILVAFQNETDAIQFRILGDCEIQDNSELDQ